MSRTLLPSANQTATRLSVGVNPRVVATRPRSIRRRLPGARRSARERTPKFEARPVLRAVRLRDVGVADQHVSQTVVWDTSGRHHGPERSDSRGEDLLALLAQLALRPDVPVERHGGDPSSRQSSDTEVSRCAIAAWASRTWAFESANSLPPWRPCARNADAHEFLTARHQT